MRPNLLFLFTDEQRIDTLACYGNTKLRMPNLNRFAEEAVVFEEPYCTQPVCTPSRGSLMTGLWPLDHGAYNNNIALNRDVRCLPELLSTQARAEYATAYMGKWHLGDEIFAQHGFDEWISTEDGYHPYYSDDRDPNARSSYHHFLVENGFVPARPLGGFEGFSRDFCARIPEQYGKPQFTATEASAFIHRNAGRPWMLAVNFLEPHMPFQSPRDEQYDPAEVDLPDNCTERPGDDQPAYLRATGKHAAPPPDDLRRITARYWGLNSLVDTHMGRILDALEESGQRDNTIVVFTSDHGDMMGAHGLMHKCFMYKESVRVPLLIRLPGQRKTGRITGPVSQIDVVPTLLELLDEGDAGAHLPGRSLAGLCKRAARGTSVAAADAASPCVIQWNPGDRPQQPAKTVSRTLVTPEGERFTHDFNGESELYDLKEDPREARNLACEPGHESRLKELRRELARWQEAVNDPVERIQPDGTAHA